MKKHLKTTQPVSSLFEKPAKDRILESSDTLFRTYGIRTSLKAIAHDANSNVETVVKYYGFHERLVSLFVKSLIQQAEQYWDELEQQHPNDAEAALRYWAFYQQGRTVDPFDPDGCYPVLLRSSAVRIPRIRCLSKLSNIGRPSVAVWSGCAGRRTSVNPVSWLISYCYWFMDCGTSEAPLGTMHRAACFPRPRTTLW